MKREYITVRSTARRPAWHAETPLQTANRLCAEDGVIPAIRLAVDRMKVHKPITVRDCDLQDAARMVEIARHEARRSGQSYEHWRAVCVLIMGRLTTAQRSAIGLKSGKVK